MAKIVNLYTEFDKRQSIIKSTTMIHSDIITVKNDQRIVDFVQVGDAISILNESSGVVRLEVGRRVNNGDFECVLLGEDTVLQVYSILGEQLITIGGCGIHQIILNNVNMNMKCLIEQQDEKLIFHPDPLTPIYVNNLLKQEATTLLRGDVLDIYGVEIIIRDHTIEIVDSVLGVEKVTLTPAKKENSLRMIDRQYKRSPRLIYREPTDTLEISIPPAEPTQLTETLLRIVMPPLTMVGVTILTGVFMSRGPYISIMLITTLLTIIMSIMSYFKQQKEYKQKVENRIEVYSHYLKRKLSEMSKYAFEQAKSRYYHNPDNAEILKMAEIGSSRMWEKAPLNHDFLHIRIGKAEIPLSFEVKLKEQDFSEKEDHLLEDAKAIRNRFKSTNYLPRTLSLTSGAVGLLGSLNIIKKQVAMIINQIGFFHSYLDVEVVHVYSAGERTYWSEFDFMPHMNSRVLHARTNIFSERTWDQVLTGFFQVLKARQNEFDEKKRSGSALTFAPHFVLIMSDMKQLIDHSIMEYLSKDVTHLGVSVIYVDQTLNNLPEHVTTVVEYRTEHEGQVVIEDGELKQERIELDYVSDDFPFAKLPRILAGYEHVQTLRSSVPKRVRYLEMFGVEKVEELNVRERWAKNEPRKTLAVPLGYRGPDDIVMLNLHEKAHGPHGLVAGTTGSGKSEIIQSYILSLATNFHPHAVGFLVIDYKGGGMANLFKGLPHLLGTITNLDGTQSMRALMAIKAELLHRQQLFSANAVNHIDGYQKLFKEGKVTEPMPHLFIINDEFAELKVEQPDFMKELVSTARIGRSLGIHLILATQKSSGVVDDQIWSNSKFKLCLKVQNTSDSNEMLRTPDAATITEPGRAYLQVGNNEIYELFQSAYSSTPYMGHIEFEDARDNRIYEINELGQYELKTQDLSKGNTRKTTILELDAVIAELKKNFDETGDKLLRSPWLNPLGEFISQMDYEVLDADIEWAKFECNQVVEQLDMVVGITDEPQNQAQNVLKMNLLNGHIGILGAGGFGKTIMIQSMIMSLVRKNTPEALHFYLLDFGQALLPLQVLPHIADFITIDEEEKIGKWTRLMIELIKKRKQLFKKVGVSDIETYRQLTGKKLNRVIIVLDNYDGVRDAELDADFDKILMMITREGLGLGIHMIASAVRSLQYQLMANMKEKITYFQIEASDVLGIVGRTQMKVPEIPGRGLVRLDNIYEFQTLLPNNETTQGRRITALREEANTLREKWSGEIPSAIPLVPEVLKVVPFLNYPTVQSVVSQPRMASLGVDFEKVESVNWDLNETPTMLVIGTKQRIKSAVETMLLTVFQKMTTLIVDTIDRYYQSFDQYGIITKEKHLRFDEIKRFIREVTKRKEMYNRLVSDGRSEEAEVLRQNWDDKLFVIMDTQAFALEIDTDEHKQIQSLMEQGQIYCVYFVYCMPYEAYNKIDGDIGRELQKARQSIVLSKMAEVSRISVSKSAFREPEIENGTANYVKNGDFMKIKLVDEVLEAR